MTVIYESFVHHAPATPRRCASVRDAVEDAYADIGWNTAYPYRITEDGRVLMDRSKEAWDFWGGGPDPLDVLAKGIGYKPDWGDEEDDEE